MTAVLVLLGAMVGAPLRYLIDRAVQSRQDSRFPWGTFSYEILSLAEQKAYFYALMNAAVHAYDQKAIRLQLVLRRGSRTAIRLRLALSGVPATANRFRLAVAEGAIDGTGRRQLLPPGVSELGVVCEVSGHLHQHTTQRSPRRT